MKFILNKTTAYFLLFTICNLYFTTVKSQTKKMDSIVRLIKNDKEDTLKLTHLHLLFKEYYISSNLDSAIYIEKRAIALAKKLNDKKSLAKFHQNIGIICSTIGKYDEGLKNHFEALKYTTELNDSIGIAKSYKCIGIIYLYQDNFPEALKYFDLHLNKSKKNTDYSEMIDAYTNMGNIHVKQGKYNIAIADYLYCLKYSELIKNEIKIARANLGLGDVYLCINDFDKSFNYYNKALNSATINNDKLIIPNIHHNIGAIYGRQGKNKLSLGKYILALRLQEELGNTNFIIIYNNDVGLGYERINDFTSAEKHYLTGLKLAIESNDKGGIALSELSLGLLYLKQNKINEAKEYLQQSLTLQKEIGEKLAIRDIYEGLYKADSISGNYKSALENHKLYMKYNDSLTSDELTKKITQQEMQFEFDKKTAISKLENDKIVLTLENQNKLQEQKQNFLIIFILAFSILMISLLFFAKRAYDNKKKYSQVLASENETKELLLREVHHRVNNSLQMISSLLAIQADTTTNEEIKEYLLKSENRIHAMSTMHHLLHMGNSKLEVDISKYLGEIVNFYSRMLEAKPNIKLSVNIPSVSFHTKVALPIALLLNELLTNSIKYAFPNNEGEINISLTNINEVDWLLTVSDNGIGFTEGKVGGKGSSLGLSLVKLMSRQLGATLNIDSSKGTFVEIGFRNSNEN